MLKMLLTSPARRALLTLAAVILIAALAVSCAFGGAGESDPPPEDTVQPVESALPQPSDTGTPWALDEEELTEEYLLSLVLDMEVGLDITFSDPDELTELELYKMFLLRSDYTQLEEECWNEDEERFYFTNERICETLSRYLKHYQFDITQDSEYDPAAGAIVTPLASGFGGDRAVKVASKLLRGDTVTFTVDFYDGYGDDGQPQGNIYKTKAYAIEFYEGGYYYLYAVEVPTVSSTDLATRYYDLFRGDDGLIILLGLAQPGAGGFSDDQLSAYALHTLAYQGKYDYETGLSREDMNAVTQKHFGRDIQNFENSMTTVLDSGRVTATGWSFDAGVHLVLDGEPEERDGATAARFKCYELSDGLWFSDEMDQEKLEHAREYLLSGDDGEFPAPRLVEIVFEERYDEQTQSPYVLYRSLTVL